jgi:hypothetical protein
MNITLAIVGALLIAVAAIRGIMAHDAKIESGEIPKDGDRRIVVRGSKIWVEEYAGYPQWMLKHTEDSIEDARANVERWNARDDEKVEVVK